MCNLFKITFKKALYFRNVGHAIPSVQDLCILFFFTKCGLSGDMQLIIQICSAQNVGKVWISREKILLAPFGAISGNFLIGPETANQMCIK